MRAVKEMKIVENCIFAVRFFVLFWREAGKGKETVGVKW